jgi:hemerythrin-like domain-containing protein
MNATEILRNEHRVIEQVLACLEKMADRCASGGPLDVTSATRALDFFRNFADRCHHGKEEGRLFPLLEGHGLPREGGPTGVMRSEHDQGRRLLHGMAAAVAAPGAPPARERFAAFARDYVSLLREHIRKEDGCLFPLADRTLSAGEQEALREAFGAVEHDEMGEGTHETYLGLADELADRWGVPKASNAVRAGEPCGCSRR